MALGRQQGEPRAFVTPPDEAPEAVPAVAAPVERRSNGQVTPGDAARQLGSRGGAKSAQRKRDARSWGARLGLGRYLSLATNEHMAPYIQEGEEWLEAACADLAESAGGGRLGPSVTSMLQSAAWQRAFGRYLMACAATNMWGFDRAADADAKPSAKPNTDLVLAASRLLDASRQNSIGAYEIASREAASRPRRSVIDEMRADVDRQLAGRKPDAQ